MNEQFPFFNVLPVSIVSSFGRPLGVFVPLNAFGCRWSRLMLSRLEGRAKLVEAVLKKFEQILL